MISPTQPRVCLTGSIDANGGLEVFAFQRARQLEQAQRECGSDLLAQATVIMPELDEKRLSAYLRDSLGAIDKLPYNGKPFADSDASNALGRQICATLTGTPGWVASVAASAALASQETKKLFLDPNTPGLQSALESLANLADWTRTSEWKGKTTWVVGQERPPADGAVHQSDPEILRQCLAQSGSARLQIDYVCGHGQGHYQLGGMPGVAAAHALSERPSYADDRLILLDTCLGMNLEALSQMGAQATVVGGETTLNSTTAKIKALPLVEMLHAAVEHSDSAPGAARAMVAKASELYDHHYSQAEADGLDQGLHALSQLLPPLYRGNRATEGELALRLGLGQTPKVSAVALPALQSQLLPTLGPLGQALDEEINQQRGAAVMQAAWQTMVPFSGQKFVDLGSFLQRLSHNEELSPATHEAAEATLRGLAACKVGENHPQDFNAGFTGVSIQICATPDDEYWKLQGLPPEWTAFVRRFTQGPPTPAA